MDTVRVSHTIDDLADDLRGIAVRAPKDMARTVRANAEAGSRIARTFARESAGKHGKLYHLAFGAESRSLMSWEYGPDSGLPQGGMSFEFGSRNQKPHLDLARSADIQGPKFARDVADLADKWFW